MSLMKRMARILKEDLMVKKASEEIEDIIAKIKSLEELGNNIETEVKLVEQPTSYTGSISFLNEGDIFNIYFNITNDRNHISVGYRIENKREKIIADGDTDNIETFISNIKPIVSGQQTLFHYMNGFEMDELFKR